MYKTRLILVPLLTAILLFALVVTAWAVPPWPSSFYGEIHISDNPPSVSDQVLAYVPDVTGSVGSAMIQLYQGELVYSIDVLGDDTDISGKDGGEEGDIITFEISNRVVATATWHGATNVNLDFHPPDPVVTDTGPVNEGSAVTIDANTSQDWYDDISTYEFDCNNDATYEIGPQPGATAQCTFDDNGVYTVGVRVIDLQGGVGTDSTTVTVNNVAPVVDAGADQTVNEGDTVNLDPATFSDAGTGDTHTATIDWGDGSPAEAGTVDQANDTVSGSHVYADNGVYTVQVTVTDDDGGVDSDTLIVTVNDVLPTNVDAHGPYNGIAGQPVSLTGSATCASVDTCFYAWDLDNDGYYDDATGQSLDHTWNTVGDYTIGLQVTDDDGSSATDSADVQISGDTHSIGLVVGWNLVSFNLQPVSTVITDVLSDIEGQYALVYAWDAPKQQWLKYDPGVEYGHTLTNLDETMGFWIQMTVATATLDVVGSVPTTTYIELNSAGAGWNLVGYPSAVDRDLPDVLQGTDFSLVYAYHANDPTDPWKLFDRTGPEYVNDLTYLSPGWGYWVKVSQNHTWAVAYPEP